MTYDTYSSVKELKWPSEVSNVSSPMGLIWPKISVITPSYNQAEYLEEAIQSVINQNYSNLEFIIIDGGSTDGSVKTIKKYERWISYWVSEPDNGQSEAINKGLKIATGDIVFWLNADDLCLPDAFKVVAEKYILNPDKKLIIGQALVINLEGEIIDKWYSKYSSWEDLITNPTNMIRQVSTFFYRGLFEELGLIDENLIIAMDTELLIRFTQNNKPLIIDDFLAAFRTHTTAKSYLYKIKGYEEADRVREKYINNKSLLLIYKKRSASRWLRMSTDGKLPLKERLICIVHAVKKVPLLLFTRKLYSSAKSLVYDYAKAAVKTRRDKSTAAFS